MIYLERTITIAKGNASIDEQIVLYKGDKNVEIKFSIKNNPFKHQSGLTPNYGQLVINREAGPIFSEVAQVVNNKVLFIVTGDMIDVAEECGPYDFQIRLFNEDKTSRATLPPVEAGILIEEPICEEEGVNAATVNYSRTRSSEGEVLEPFDEEGNYNKTIWADGDLITDSKLNKIEDAIYEINNPADLEVSNSISMGRIGDVGANSVALGTDCQAGDYTSAIGYGLIANANFLKRGQCVVGRYNEQDNNALFIVGSGTSDSSRKNVLLVDSNSATINGVVYTDRVEPKDIFVYDSSSKGDIEFVKIDETGVLIKSKEIKYDENGNVDYFPEEEYVATKEYVNNAIANIDLTSYATKNELTSYATQSYVNNAISNIDIPEVDLTSYATETYVKTAIAEAQLDGGEVDLSGYATKDDIGDINAILDNLNGEVI